LVLRSGHAVDAAAGEVKLMTLNAPEVDANGKPIEKNGEPVLKYDIRTGDYGVYVEEVPDVATQTEYARELVLKALQAVGMVGMTPGLLELMGVPKSAQLMQEVQQGLPIQQAAQAAQAQNGFSSASRTCSSAFNGAGEGCLISTISTGQLLAPHSGHSR
jgi:hypothetical protein